MAYEVLARKWRPKNFDDVVGQDHVTRTLKNAIEADRVAHAYLFVGSRGIGKTSLARIFAKVLNCEKGPTATPCDKCTNCLEITAGSSLDVIEIDGASNNGVEQVRDLREQVQFVPANSKYKVIIIDEVHMLTAQAFNALLKTLEEPPAHVKFIFATTEGDKVLATIVSRCQRFDLHRIPSTLIVERLRHICEYERIKVDDDTLLAIARGAEGGMRDALSALDQLISFKGNELGEEDVLAVFGLISRQSLEELAQAILNGEVGTILQKVAIFDSVGKDMRRMTVELMEYFRNLLVYLYVGAEIETLDVTPEQIEALAKLAKLTNANRVVQITELLADMEARLRYALSVRTLIELTLIRCARAAKVVSLDEVLRKLNELRTVRAVREPPSPPASAPVRAVREPPSSSSSPPAQSPARSVREPSPPVPPSAPAQSDANLKPLYDEPVLQQVIKEFDGRVTSVE